jgi:hypothetical protein
MLRLLTALIGIMFVGAEYYLLSQGLYYLATGLFILMLLVVSVALVVRQIRRRRRPQSPTQAPLPAAPNEDHVSKVQTDASAPRYKFIRWFVFLILACGIVLGPALVFVMVAAYIDRLLPLEQVFAITRAAGFAGVALGIYLLGFALPYLSIVVPPVQAAVTQNVFGGWNIPYGSGWHPRFPWERVTRRSHLPLDLITLEATEPKVATNSGPVEVHLILMFRPVLEHIVNFFGLDESTVRSAFDSVMKAYLSAKLIRGNIESAVRAYPYLTNAFKRRFGIEEQPDEPVEADMEAIYGSLEDETDRGVAQKRRWEQEWGIQIGAMLATSIDPPESVLKAQAAIAEATALNRARAERLLMTPEELRAAARRSREAELLTHRELEEAAVGAEVLSENATRTVQTIQIPGLVQGLAAFGQALGRALGGRG